MKNTYPTITVSKAQKTLPALCRSGEATLITNHDKPQSVLLPIADYEALMETIEILSDPAAMKVLKAAKAGKLKYKKLNLNDENLGL